MRHLLVAACGAALVLTATSAALAASFSGPPFLISQDNPPKPISGPVYETASGDIAAVLARDETAGYPQLTEAIYLKLFNPDGTLKSAKTLVYRAKPTSVGPATVSIAGAMPLTDGRLMVAYSEKRDDLYGLFARIVTGGQNVGPEFAIHTEPPDADPDYAHRVDGFLLPLASGGVTIWAYAGNASDLAARAQLVSGSGEISPVESDLTRARNYVTSASSYLDGFIVRYSNPKPGRSNQFAQIFGPNGKKLGPEKQLEQDAIHMQNEDVRTLGLTDGSIVVLRKRPVNRSYEFSAEVFDGRWERKKAETVIATSKSNVPFGAAAVPGGDFLFGVTNPDSVAFSDLLEFQRLSPSLKRKGAPLRMTGLNSPVIQQMVARANGDVLMTYIWYSPDSRTKKFSGRFIKP